MRHLLFILGFSCLFLAARRAVRAADVRSVVSGDTLMVADSLLMREVVVAAAIRPIVLRGDTLVYDVASFPLVEGSRLRELLKRLPGVEVSIEGVVTAQGKVVSRILLNGKNFFSGNKEVALDNLPADILTEVKVYERPTEANEEMGMVTAEKEKVIDVTTKPDKNRGWFCDVTAGGGTEERYAGNVSLSQFNELWQNLLSVNGDNLPLMFGVGDSYYDKLNRTASSGDTDKQNYNLIVGRSNGAWEVTGTAYYDHWQTDNGSRSLMESFLQDESSYTSTVSSGRSAGRSFTSSVQLSWKDSLTSVYVEPGFNFSQSHNTSYYSAFTYDADPNLFTLHPLDLGFEVPLEHYINSNRNESEDSERSTTLTLHTRVNRKLNRKGRNLNVEAHMEAGRTTGDAFSLNDLSFYRMARREMSVRYQDSPARNRSVSGRISYVEPLAVGLKALLEYGVGYRYQHMEQPVYNLDHLFADREGYGPRPIESPETFSDSLSRFATNRYWNHRIRALLQYVHGGLNLTAGVLCNPQRTETTYRKFRTRVDTVRTVLNWSPEFSFYYRRNDSWNLTLHYAGESAQPDLFYLLPILDDTDPLNARTGNPGLRPSFTHTMSISFYSFDMETQRQISLGASSQVIRNAMTQSICYNAVTGGRSMMPVNINGNRNFSATWSLSTSFRNGSEWYLDCQGELGWRHCVGLQQVDRPEAAWLAQEMRYTTRQANVQNYAGVQYRKRFFTVKPYGYFAYEASRSSLSGALERNVWIFGYGFVARCELDCGLSVATDVYNHSRHGYVGGDLNGDEFICDAEVAYSFLRGRAATVRLQACDLFRNRALTSGYIGLTGRKETAYTHSVNSYVLLSFTYRFSLFGLRRDRRA